jgi:hypothetical protein
MEIISFWQFFIGPALTLPFLMLAGICGDSKVRFLLLCGAILIGAVAAGIFFNPHWAAPGTALFFVLLVQCMRRLRHLEMAWQQDRSVSGALHPPDFPRDAACRRLRACAICKALARV